MWYVGKFDEATWQFLAALGLTPSRFREEGAGMVTAEQRIGYKRELHAGDVVSVRSAVLEVMDKAIRIAHELRNDDTGEVAATVMAVGVYIDALARRACSLPPDVRERAVRLTREDGAINERCEEPPLEVAQ